jgi:uncharacterized protein with GYD domain
MVTYMLLMKLTDLGLKELKNSPQRIDEGIKSFENMGGKVLGFYAAAGEYDFVSLGEAPNDETAITFALGLSAQGYVKTTSVKLFDVNQYKDMAKKLA